MHREKGFQDMCSGFVKVFKESFVSALEKSKKCKKSVWTHFCQWITFSYLRPTFAAFYGWNRCSTDYRSMFSGHPKLHFWFCYLKKWYFFSSPRHADLCDGGPRVAMPGPPLVTTTSKRNKRQDTTIQAYAPCSKTTTSYVCQDTAPQYPRGKSSLKSGKYWFFKVNVHFYVRRT